MFETAQLRGIAKPLAEMYGKPHWGSSYLSKNPTPQSVDRYRLDDGATCIVCGQRATNSHHTPPKGIMRVFELMTPKGRFKYRPALIAMCGSGTTGCHGMVHKGMLKIEWVWDSDGFESGWWDGSIPETITAHDPELYSVGFWRIIDREGNVIREVRG